jgi:hypothetical protein
LIFSLQLISILTATREPDYTQGWFNIFGASFILIFVAIPSFILMIFFVLEVIITEIKIIDRNKAKKA